MDKDTGGQAFPAFSQDCQGHIEREQIGMTLRDYFAGQVLSGMLSNGYNQNFANVDAYKIADAMIAERNKE